MPGKMYTVREANVEIAGVEQAVDMLHGLVADGTLGTLEAEDAQMLISAASANPSVFANAFGGSFDHSDNSDALYSRLYGLYLRSRFDSLHDQAVSWADARKKSIAMQRRSSMVSALGLTPEDVSRFDVDEAVGDESPWQGAKEKFIFG